MGLSFSSFSCPEILRQTQKKNVGTYQIHPIPPLNSLGRSWDNQHIPDFPPDLPHSLSHPPTLLGPTSTAFPGHSARNPGHAAARRDS